ncbi:prolyl 3-hydroxylase /prolyl 3,4-dihydroxylase [Nematocida homosporus]|uniref:prolyl 3-hydroxylase /prolyl 3,4-dihydroxylase n=1 Tax=Nematocida homosporus TaxID=1912981 RepID=UPI00221EC4CB|nr:prolyl 3-hydroxylase /prolyl 3,4-dihydroxylase [Nematocida homosporus]KAI5185530.1 prolyl 3-hydroxylase /prolyl 3,4-dihydroxylase [Nematocida homosporus]
MSTETGLSLLQGAVFRTPYYHRVIDDFLPPDVLARLLEKHDGAEYFEKHTDLFHFYQTEELNKKKDYAEFLEKVKSAMAFDLAKIGKAVAHPEMDLFGSYYEKGDYLLPHDDCVDDRVLAFSFYLNTPARSGGSTNGELALFHNDGISLAKAVAPKTNRMVIFEVSDKSYHEVQSADGVRMALTGWLRSKEHAPMSCIPPYQPNLAHFIQFSNADTKITEVPEEIVQVGLDEAMGEALAKTLSEFSWKPRLNLLSGRVLEVDECNDQEKTRILLPWILENSHVLDSMCIKIPEMGYLLLNDPFNDSEGALVIISLFDGDVILVSEEGEPMVSLQREQMYLCPRNTNVFIPLNQDSPTGYVIAYRVDMK